MTIIEIYYYAILYIWIVNTILAGVHMYKGNKLDKSELRKVNTV